MEQHQDRQEEAEADAGDKSPDHGLCLDSAGQICFIRPADYDQSRSRKFQKADRPYREQEVQRRRLFHLRPGPVAFPAAGEYRIPERAAGIHRMVPLRQPRWMPLQASVLPGGGPGQGRGAYAEKCPSGERGPWQLKTLQPRGESISGCAAPSRRRSLCPDEK